MSTQRSEIERRVAEHPFWYHRIELPHGVVTPGWAPLDEAAYQLPDSFEGKRVLDVGAWDGFWTFRALERGAREVVAIDDFSDTMGVLDQGDRRRWATFDLCRSLLGWDEARCKRREMSVYDVCEEGWKLESPDRVYHSLQRMLAKKAAHVSGSPAKRCSPR